MPCRLAGWLAGWLVQDWEAAAEAMFAEQDAELS